LDVFRELVFFESPPLADRFGWGNSNSSFVVDYLDHRGLDVEIVESLCSIFSKDFHPFDLRDEFYSIVREHDFMVPHHLILEDIDFDET
jgi:hypothetical protein